MIERVLFTEEQVAARVKEVAAEITARYEGREVKLIGVLKGSVFFLTALACPGFARQDRLSGDFQLWPKFRRDGAHRQGSGRADSG